MPSIDLGPLGARSQRHVVSELGRDRVRAALAAGEVQSPWRGVLVDPSRAAEPLTLIAAARLAIGDAAVVTGPSAAYLHNLTAVPPTPVHLVLPYEVRKQHRGGIVVHNGTALDDDCQERHGLPVLSLERVVADLACTLPPWHALAVLDEAIALHEEQYRPAFRRRLCERVQDRPDPRGTRIGRRLIDLATGEAESISESWLLWRVVDLGFPVPDVNPWIFGLDGVGLYRVDLGWCELRIAVEYNGYAAHAGREEYDASRVRDLERRGWIVVVIEAHELFGGVRLEKELADAFARRGVDLRGRVVRALRPRPHREARSS
jgi:Protein of unknown function (DUF559)